MDLGDDVPRKHDAEERAEVERNGREHEDPEESSVRPVGGTLNLVKAKDPDCLARRVGNRHGSGKPWIWVVWAGRAIEPPVHGIAILLPEAGLNFVDDSDARQPFQGLVAEHGSDVEPHWAAVL